MKYVKWCDESVELLKELVQNGLTWPEITDELKTAGFPHSKASIKEKWYSIRDDKQVTLKERQNARRARKQATQRAKEVREVLDGLNSLDDLEERFSKLVAKVNKKEHKIRDIGYRVGGVPMVIECLLSDLHYGKKTNKFNYAVARKRMKLYAEQVINSIQDKSDQGYDVQEIVVGLLGDIIESSTMHGPESLKGCEFGNSEQMVKATESLYHDFFEPLVNAGVKIRVKAIPGNHERTDPKKTFHKPGREYMSFVIYNFLEKLLKQSYPNADIKFDITDGPCATHKIFGDVVLYEHGDMTKGNTKAALTSMLAKRQQQLGQIVEFYRVGHTHEYTVYDRGRIMVNGCLPGNDDYAEALGFRSESSQTINFYCKTKNRPNSFYYSYAPFLGEGE